MRILIRYGLPGLTLALLLTACSSSGSEGSMVGETIDVTLVDTPEVSIQTDVPAGGGCASQADCGPDEYCNPPSCAGCPGTCIPHGCPTETEATCAMVRPECVGVAVSVIQDGCWVCVNPLTCGDAEVEQETDAGEGPEAVEAADVVEPDGASEASAPDSAAETVETAEEAAVEEDAVEEITPEEATPETIPETSEPIEGTWFDAATGLRWEEPPSDDKQKQADAAAYCAALEIGGLGDWRLPTVGELRGLIRGCDDTVVGGSCGVDDACVQASCGGLFGCLGCEKYQGPADGCYWPAELGGTCAWYWSSTKVEGALGGASYWAALYEDGSLRQSLDLPITTNNVRCVR